MLPTSTNQRLGYIIQLSTGGMCFGNVRQDQIYEFRVVFEKNISKLGVKQYIFAKGCHWKAYYYKCEKKEMQI